MELIGDVANVGGAIGMISAVVTVLSDVHDQKTEAVPYLLGRLKRLQGHLKGRSLTPQLKQCVTALQHDAANLKKLVSKNLISRVIHKGEVQCCISRIGQDITDIYGAAGIAVNVSQKQEEMKQMIEYDLKRIMAEVAVPVDKLPIPDKDKAMWDIDGNGRINAVEIGMVSQYCKRTNCSQPPQPGSRTCKWHTCPKCNDEKSHQNKFCGGDDCPNSAVVNGVVVPLGVMHGSCDPLAPPGLPPPNPGAAHNAHPRPHGHPHHAQPAHHPRQPVAHHHPPAHHHHGGPHHHV
eukprot:TRINITY_DN67134_c3_g1_i1.p1 TRINITY_DN67134_c3_g1~~TRINITY_DN67134_c3_g1_i1.p1  ORF type:complete len:292 (+),score=22.03 TRINITY_DN67134_c3_g1_i1:35-910(+)